MEKMIIDKDSTIRIVRGERQEQIWFSKLNADSKILLSTKDNALRIVDKDEKPLLEHCICTPDTKIFLDGKELNMHNNTNNNTNNESATPAKKKRESE